jgi:hypothetical protein
MPMGASVNGNTTAPPPSGSDHDQQAAGLGALNLLLAALAAACVLAAIAGSLLR